MVTLPKIRDLSISAITLCSVVAIGPAFAQPGPERTIQVEDLGPAKAFAPGIDVAGELPRTAWAGTDADTAVQLLKSIPAQSAHPVVRDMRRRVVLAGLAPPSGAGDAFERARIGAAQALATPDEYARFAARNPAAQDPNLRAEVAIAQGDLDSACALSDTITQGRGEAFWLRVRAACHDYRGETALAELARDLLRDRNEDPDLVVPDAPQSFWVVAMALGEIELITYMEEIADWPEPIAEPDTVPLLPEADLDLELDLDVQDALNSGPLNLLPDETDALKSDDSVATDLMDSLTESEDIAIDELPQINLGEIVADDSDQETARLFLLGRDGDAKAVSEFVGRAVEAGLDADRVMGRIPALLDPTEMAAVDLPLFARYAVATGNIPLIQALYVATDNLILQQRLALASDALGGAYFDQPLGEGLEVDLEVGGPVVRGDVMIALGLGARLSDRAEAALRVSGLPVPVSGTLIDWLAVDQALDRGAQAETLLRLASLIPDDGVAGSSGSQEALILYWTLRGLRKSGFSDLANRLAAYEFLRGL